MKESNDMTAERSLEIISQMVEQTRHRVEDNAWKPMLYWGFFNIVIALAVGYLWAFTSLGPAANFLWFLVVLAVFVLLPWRGKQAKQPTTYLYKAIGKVWAWFGYTCGTLGFIYGLVDPLARTLGVQGPVVIPITPIIILMMGLGSTITGSLIKSRAITVCGFLTSIIGGTVGFFVRGPWQMGLLAICLFISLVIPALMIKISSKSCSNH